MADLLKGEFGWLLIVIVFWAIVFWIEDINKRGGK